MLLFWSYANLIKYKKLFIATILNKCSTSKKFFLKQAYHTKKCMALTY